jgi:hypothetical protein
MSFRFLYRTVPVAKRLCSYYRCQKPILRNIARDKTGHLFHYGCLQTARDEQYRCLECFSIFDATEAAFTEKQIVQGDEVQQALQPICPNCGCQNLKPLGMATAKEAAANV